MAGLSISYGKDIHMIYWLLTTYRLNAGLFIGTPLVLVALIGLPIVAWYLGQGGPRTSKGEFSAEQLRVLLPELALVFLATLHLALPVAAAVGIKRATPQAATWLATALVGPAEYDSSRLLIGAAILFGVGGMACLFTFLQLRDGGWLREQVSLLRDPTRRSGELGSATFITPGQMTHLQKDKGPFQLPLYGKFYGTWGPMMPVRLLQRIDTISMDRKQAGRILFSAEDQARGMAIIGPPGTGKSQAGILPILAEAMKAGQSAIVLDPQSELLKYALDFARVTNHRVIVHDPTEPAAQHVNLAQGAHSVPEARAIANLFVSTSKAQGGAAFWENSANNLLAACLLRFGSLGEILGACSNLKGLAKLLEMKDDEAKMLASAFISDALYADGKTSSGVLSQLLASPLINWSDPDVRLATDRTDFAAAQLVDQPTVIVLKCPGRYMKGFGPYLSAILQKLMLDLDTIGEKAGGALPRPVKIIIDEFPVMGKLDAVVEAVNLFRKRRISFVVAMQSIAQLYNIYGRDGAETLISGMATQIVFGSCDHATAQYVTQVLGKATRQVEATFMASSDSRSQRQVRVRDLMTVDEVISPSRGNCTVLYRYATTTYAAQVVMLAALSYMFDRDDWQKAIQTAHPQSPAGENRQTTSFKPMLGRSPIPGDLAVTANPFAKKKPEQPSAQPMPVEDPPAEGFVTGDF